MKALKALLQKLLDHIDMRAQQQARYDEFLFHQSRFGGVPF